LSINLVGIAASARSGPLALGVEEEALLVGSDHEFLDRGSQVVSEIDPSQGDVARELFKSMVESKSEIFSTAGEALADLDT
jgi:gamma-glutamyl:cysteine ligase YbdK (ATP-grasp superfamily)